jgi:hypothetical protein
MANHSPLRKWGLNPRKGVEHYSVTESNIYWVRALAGRFSSSAEFSAFAKSLPLGWEQMPMTEEAGFSDTYDSSKLAKDDFCAVATLPQ